MDFNTLNEVVLVLQRREAVYVTSLLQARQSLNVLLGGIVEMPDTMCSIQPGLALFVAWPYRPCVDVDPRMGGIMFKVAIGELYCFLSRREYTFGTTDRAVIITCCSQKCCFRVRLTHNVTDIDITGSQCFAHSASCDSRFPGIDISKHAARSRRGCTDTTMKASVRRGLLMMFAVLSGADIHGSKAMQNLKEGYIDFFGDYAFLGKDDVEAVIDVMRRLEFQGGLDGDINWSFPMCHALHRSCSRRDRELVDSWSHFKCRNCDRFVTNIDASEYVSKQVDLKVNGIVLNPCQKKCPVLCNLCFVKKHHGGYDAGGEELPKSGKCYFGTTVCGECSQPFLDETNAYSVIGPVLFDCVPWKVVNGVPVFQEDDGKEMHFVERFVEMRKIFGWGKKGDENIGNIVTQDDGDDMPDETARNEVGGRESDDANEMSTIGWQEGSSIGAESDDMDLSTGEARQELDSFDVDMSLFGQQMEPDLERGWEKMNCFGSEEESWVQDFFYD